MFLGWVNAVQYGESDEGRQFEADVSDHDFCQWRDHGGYFENMMGRVGDASHITHWMPLPAAPSTAAGASERADADTAGAWTYDQVVMLCETDGVPLPVDFIEWVAEKMTRAANEAFIAAGASQERADAGKDAALTDEQIRDIWLRETGFDEQAAPFAILEFARAILAANKEPPDERAEPRALPDWRIADGWHNTFSTSNPYCPCDLKSFTKAVRWAEHAIEQAVKERK
jgi:hypothetical protein